MLYHFALMKILIYQFGCERTAPTLFDFHFYIFHYLILNFSKNFPISQFFELFQIFVDSIIHKNCYLCFYFSTKVLYYYQLIDFEREEYLVEYNSIKF